MLKTGTVVALVVVMGLLVGACAPAGISSPAAKAQIFTWSDSSELLMRVPCCESTADKNTEWFLHQMFGTMVRFAPGTADIVPDLATSWDVSQDGRTWTFHLRKGVTFSDGSPLTADDVKYSIDLVRAYPQAAYPTFVEKINVVDDSTVAVVTKDPNSTVLYWMQAAGSLIQSRKSTPDNPIGTGPYVLKQWNRGENAVLEKRNNYWGTPPALEKIVYLKRPETTTRLVGLSKGEVDMTKLTPEDIEALKTTPGIRFDTPASSMLVGIRLNLRTPPYDKKEVRQALNYAIDKEAIVKNLLVGAGYAPDGLAGKGVWATVHLDGGYYPFDLKRAEALMQQAGLVKTGGRWMFGGKPLTFRLYSPEGRYLKDRVVAEYVVQQLNSFGITVAHEIAPWSVWGANINKKQQQAEIDGGMNGLSSLHPILNYGNALSCAEKDRGATAWCNGQYDDFIKKAQTTFSEPEQLDLYAKAQGIAVNDAVWLLLYGQNPVWGVRDYVTGLKFTPNEIPITENVSIK
jgi:ABC-type transport system substrate-binding protein